MVADMGFYVLLAVGFVGVVAFLLVVGRMYPGNGADLLDYDPIGRAAKKILVEEEDIEQMRELRSKQEELEQQRAAHRGDTQ